MADINLDMLGRNAPDLMWAMGETLSTLGSAFWDQVDRHPELGLHPIREGGLPSTFEHSDQVVFAASGVPALFLHTGSHPDLHRPSDELARLDTDKAARVARLAFYLAYAVASDGAAPAWTVVGQQARARLRPVRGVCGK